MYDCKMKLSNIEKIHAFFVSNTFIGNARLKLKKNQVKAKQKSEAELLLFENCLLSCLTLPSNSNMAHSKK